MKNGDLLKSGIASVRFASFTSRRVQPLAIVLVVVTISLLW